MKNMNMKKRYWTMNLQVFAGDGGDDDPGDEGGDDDEPGDDDDDSDDDDDPEENEKKFSQKDVDDAVKKRLAREKRKWQREQQKKAGKKPNGKVKTGENSEKEDDDTETQELRDKAAKADEMEMKWTCLEHDVDKACVDDVLALARVHMDYVPYDLYPAYLDEGEWVLTKEEADVLRSYGGLEGMIGMIDRSAPSVNVSIQGQNKDFDYEKFGRATVDAMLAAGIGFKCDDREFARLIKDLIDYV